MTWQYQCNYYSLHQKYLNLFFLDDFIAELLQAYYEAYDDLQDPLLASRLRQGLNQAYTKYNFEFVTFENNIKIISPSYMKLGN